jgi:hypothetical protein
VGKRGGNLRCSMLFHELCKLEKGLYCMLGSLDYLTSRLGGWFECSYDALLFPLKSIFLKSCCEG